MSDIDPVGHLSKAASDADLQAERRRREAASFRRQAADCDADAERSERAARWYREAGALAATPDLQSEDQISTQRTEIAIRGPIDGVRHMAGLTSIRPDGERAILVFDTAPGCQPVDPEFIRDEALRMGATEASIMRVLRLGTHESPKEATVRLVLAALVLIHPCTFPKGFIDGWQVNDPVHPADIRDGVVSQIVNLLRTFPVD